jgi:plasmid replication initiation protein
MNALTVVPIQDRYINMSNALARSAQNLSLSEKRVVALALAKTNSLGERAQADLNANRGWSIKLTAEEYSAVYEIDSRTAYDQLKTAGYALMRKEVSTREKTDKGMKETRINWCAGSIYHHGQGWIEISFSHLIAPHLLELKSKFTSYKLTQTKAIRSVYSWRLFECLQSWKDTGRWKVSVDDFCATMNTPESYKLNFKELRVNVLMPALNELFKKNGIIIDVYPTKTGRKVTGLDFRFEMT